MSEGSSAGWLTAQRYDLGSSPRAGDPPKEEKLTYAAAIRLRTRGSAFTGDAVSTRIKAPSRVRKRKFASTRAPSKAQQEASSSPQSRRACASVRHSPG